MSKDIVNARPEDGTTILVKKMKSPSEESLGAPNVKERNSEAERANGARGEGNANNKVAEATKTTEMTGTGTNGNEKGDKVDEVGQKKRFNLKWLNFKRKEKRAEQKEQAEQEEREEQAKQEVAKKKVNPVLNWLSSHKILIIILCIVIPILVLVLVWAFVIAPAVAVSVEIRTTNNNFSQNITFTENLADENAAEGKFFLQKKTSEMEVETTFEATGEKNIGEKATGEVVVYAFFKSEGSETIKKGTIFQVHNLSYISDADVALVWDGESSCENRLANALRDGCQISARVAVTAAEPGMKYNTEAENEGWRTNVGVGVYSDKAITGGTDDIVTVVKESDIEKAKSQLISENEEINREKLLDLINGSEFMVDSSIEQTASIISVTPQVDEVVKDNEEPKLKVKLIATALTVDKTKIEEFIKKTASTPENYEIYGVGTPFIESFMKSENGYVGKLKTSYVTGPRVTENDVVNIIKGKGLGTAQHDLKDINGISSIKLEPSYPWVTSVPNDPDKITVTISIEE
ncbi:MAG: hypothetical protein Q4A79_02070 [Candidatus Saccharibacteria bacterium]|nr:hypothetical protein [Candidatus Saccharibacteria bacterium]